jgi:hypothetical protein
MEAIDRLIVEFCFKNSSGDMQDWAHLIEILTNISI